MTEATDTARARFERTLHEAHAAKADYVHLIADEPSRARCASDLVTLREPALDAAGLQAVARELFGPARLERLPLEGVVSTSFRLDAERFGRATYATNLGRPSLGVRFHRPSAGITLEYASVPQVVSTLLDATHGLIVVAGPTGSGKTTTLFALVDWLNKNRAVHICTVEDTVVQHFRSDKALVQQREVGTDVPDVARAITAAMDQDLDVLAITALTDVDSLGAALYVVETGHLVLLQLHADGARGALERLVEAAPSSMQPYVRRTLAEHLVGVVAQRLVPRATKGRVPVHEVLLPDDALRAAVREGRSLEGLAGAPGSITVADRAAQLEQQGLISAETAARLRGA